MIPPRSGRQRLVQLDGEPVAWLDDLAYLLEQRRQPDGGEITRVTISDEEVVAYALRNELVRMRGDPWTIEEPDA